MIARLLRLFRRPKIQIPGTARIVEGEARKVDLGDPGAGGRQVLLCRIEGKLYALDNHCPHDKGGRMQAGPLVDGCFARCPLHNYQYDPRDGSERHGASKKGQTYAIAEKNGDGFLSL